MKQRYLRVPMAMVGDDDRQATPRELFAGRTVDRGDDFKI
jgi:hypothetical protein